MGVLCQRPKGLVISFLLLLALLFSVSASAQITSQTGAVRVFVTDPQGAAVAGAKVTLSSGVRADLTKETIADGSVVFPLVTPGTYKVTVEAPNFSRTVLSNVDRKSTRLNSSHGYISYAVFCLKKKKLQSYRAPRRRPTHLPAYSTDLTKLPHTAKVVDADPAYVKQPIEHYVAEGVACESQRNI